MNTLKELTYDEAYDRASKLIKHIRYAETYDKGYHFYAPSKNVMVGGHEEVFILKDGRVLYTMASFIKACDGPVLIKRRRYNNVKRVMYEGCLIQN